MKKRVLRWLLLVAVLAAPWTIEAQNARDYQLATGVDTTKWVTLSSSAVDISSIEGEDDEGSELFNIGFPFTFAGTSYTQFSCNSNGRVRLGALCSSGYDNPFNELTDPDNNDLPFITAFGMDNTLEASGSHVKYELTGTAPNRILVIEYRTPSEYNDEGDLVNYQIQLMEDSSRIRIVYGLTAASYYDSYQIGIAASATDILMINPSTHSAFFTGTSTTFSAWPGVGRYYQLTPAPPATCPALAGITLNSVTAGGIMLSWTCLSGATGTPASYEVVCGPADNSTAPTTTSVTSPYIILSGLAPTTSYKVRVRANCGTDGYGDWDSIIVSTNPLPCLATGTVDTLLFSDGTSTNSGTLVYSSWGNTMYQAIYTASELTEAGLSAGPIVGVDFGFANNTTAKEFSIFMGSTLQNSFSSPTDYANPGTLQQVYGPTAHPTGTSGFQHYTFGQPFMWDGVSNIIVCTFMNQPTGVNQTSSGFSGYYTTAHTGSSLYRYKDNVQFTLDNYTTSSGGSTTANRASIHFYTAPCTQLSTCTAPAAWVDSVGTDEATLSWMAGYQETSWDVEYRVQGSAAWQLATSMLSATTYTLSGLNPATTYDVRVLNICGMDTFATTLTLTTECVPVAHDSLPFNYGFENLTSTGSGSPLATCWSRGYLSGSTFNGASYPYASTTTPHTGIRSLYFYGYGTSSRSWLCLPEFEDSINTLQVAFWGRKSSDSYSGQIKLGVMTDPSDYTTFQTVYTLYTDGSTSWNHFDMPMSAAPGSGFITIMVEGGSTSTNYIYIDDISVFEIPNCPHVSNLQLDSVYTDWASVSWTEMGSATSWVVEYDTVDFVPGSGTAAYTVNANDSNAMLLNLNPGTTYYLYVRADCVGDTSTWEGITFTTLRTVPATVPYMCTFEESGNNGWELINGSQTNQWFVGSAANNGGTQSLYISNDNGANNAYTNTATSFVFAERTFTLSDTGEYAYSFDWRANGESSYDFIRTALVPATTEFTAGGYCGFDNSTAVPTGGIALDGPGRLNLQSSWQTRSGVFRLNTPGTYKWVFMWRNDPSVGNQPPAAIDNVQLVRNTCPAPSNLATTSVGSNDATITWTAGGSENLWIVSDGYNEDVATSNIYTFYNLQPNTSYNFTVRAVCSADDTSMAASITVVTDCGKLSTFPFVENFESQNTTTNTTANSTFIRCWHHLNNGTQYFGYPYISSSASYNHTQNGTKGLYWYGSTTATTYGDYYYIVLPAIDTDLVTLNSLRMSFWAKVSSTSYHPVFNVGVMTDPDDITTYTNVGDVYINPGSSTAWNKFTTEFDTYAGYGSYIAIRALRPSSSWYVYMDDITVDLIPDCPEVTNITASHITTEQADISWTETGDAESWSVEYGLVGFESGSGTYETTTDPYLTIIGLLPNTNYEVRITPDCMGIAATESFIFRTECTPMISLPYSMGFETSDGVASTGASNTTTFVECWHRLNNGTEYFGYPYVASSTTYAHTGSRGLYWYNTTTTGTYGDYQTVVLPAIDTDLFDITSLRLKFWAKSSGTTYYPVFQVGVLSDPGDNSTFQQVGTVNVDNSTAWRKYIVNLDNFTGTGANVALRAVRGTTWYAYVDDITLEAMPDCPEVSNIVAQNPTASSVDINWTETGSATQWTVEYGLQGFTPGSGTSAVATEHPFAITGLSPNTEYDVYITPDCSGTTVAEMGSFRTECTPTSAIPYTMSFETSDGVTSTGSSTSETFVECWHRLNNGTQYFGYPYVAGSTTYAHTGSRGLYWYNTTTTGTYGDYQIVVLPAIDVTTHPINTLQLSFWAKASSTSYSPVFTVGVMTDPYNPSTFQQLGIVNVSNSTQWEEFTTGLAGYSGSGQYVAIRALRGASWYAYVDDISLTPAPVCPAIVDLEVSQLGTTGALTSWDYLAGFSGTPTSCAVDVFRTSNDSLVGTFTATSRSQLISGLEPNTSYRVRITPNCGGGEYGAPDSITFRTNNLPCIEFDSTISDTVLFSDGTTGTNGIFVNSAWGNTFCQSIYTAAELNEAGVHAGHIKGIRVGYTAAGNYDKELTIFMGNTNLSSISSTANMVNPSTLTQVYGPETRLANSSSVGWVYYTFDTAFVWDGISNIILSTFMNQDGSSQSSSGFYAYSTNTTRSGASIYRYKDSSPFTLSDCLSSGNSGSASTYLPSISFITDGCSLTGTCARPMIVVDSAGTDYIAISWTAGNQENAWDVEYREDGDNTWTAEGTVSTTSYTFTNLNADQAYEIRITALCGDTSLATTISVTTPCDAQPLPFTTSFEGFPTSTITSPMPSCWTRHNNYSTTSGYPYASTSYRLTGSYAMYMYSTSSSYSYFTMPIFAASVDSLRATFWLYKSNTSYPHNLKIGVMTDPEDVTTFTEVATVAPSELSVWEQFEVYFDNYTGDGQYITFMSPNGEYSYPYLDDLTIDYIPNCRRVQNVTVNNITLHTADVSWPANGISDFDIVCVPTGTSPDQGVVIPIYGDSSYTLTGLSHSTAYTVYVRAYCYPDTSEWSMGTRFRTECGLIDSLPFFEDFEAVATGSSTSRDFVPCWTRLNNGTSYYGYPYIGNSTSYSHNGGTHGLYWYSTNTTGTYGDYMYVILPTLDTTALSPSDVQLSFWAKSSSTSYYPTLEVGVMNNDVDTNFTRLRTIEVGNSTNWEQFTIPFSRYHGNGNRIAIRALRAASIWYAYVDEIRLDSVPSCPAPLEIAVDSIGVTDLGFSWIPSGSETSWAVSVGDIDTVVSDTSILLSDLIPNTEYDITVRAICGVGDTSDATTSSARTECIIISSLPWSDDFETYTSGTSSSDEFRVPCWERFTDATSYYYPYLANSTTYNHTNGGSKGLYWYVTSTTSYGTYQVVSLPLIDTTVLSLNTLQFSFWAKSSGTTYNPTFVIGAMTDDDPTTFTPIDTLTINGNTNWEMYEFAFNNYTGHGNRFALRTAYSMTNAYWYAYLDDFMIEPISPCPRPDSLAASNATSNSVTLSWHENDYATSWVIEYGPRGFQPGTGTMVTATSNPYVLTGLPSSYDGEFYVRSLCFGGDTAFYNRQPCPFSTAQVPATIPYHFNFENTTEWDAWQTNSNSHINWARGTAVSDSGSYSMYISPNSGTTYGNENFSSLVNASAYRDIDFGTIDSSFTITFRAKVGGTTSNTYDALMVFLVDPAIAVEAPTANITSPWGNVNDLYTVAAARLDTNWHTYTASFDTISGIRRVAFFWFNQNTGASYPYIGGPAAVDNIHIVYSSCPRPVNLHPVAINTTTATLEWDGPAAAQYRVAWREAGASPSTNTYINTTTNRVTITGLDTLVNYVAWVQKICGTDSSLFSDGYEFQTEMCDNGGSRLSYDPAWSTTTTSYAPIGYSFYNYSYTQTIIDSAQLAGLSLPITAMAFNPVNGNQGSYFNHMDIYLSNISESNLSSGFIMPDDSAHLFVQVTDDADLTYTDGGWFIFALDTTFQWDGHSNILVSVNRRHGSYQSGASFNAHNTSTAKTRYIYRDSPGAYDPTSMTGGTALNLVGDLKLIACPEGPICREPIITSVTYTHNTATVTWQGDGTDYEVNIKETSATSWPATDIHVTGNSYTFTGLTPSTNYVFRVRQDCSADTLGFSSWVEGSLVTDSLPCLPPDSLIVTATTNATATLDWASNGNETAWDIHVWFTGGLDSIYRVTTHPATIGGFRAGLTYNAAIRALCSTELFEGDWGDTITFSTAVCPNVASASASNVTANSADISWTADPMAQSWIVEYGFNGFDQGTGTTVTATTNSYQATGLECDAAYDFYVRAVCGDDWTSENWTLVTFRTADCSEACNAPTGIETSVTANSVAVSWTPAEGNTAFEVEYGARGFSHGTGTTVSTTEPSATINGLEFNTQYDLYVRALCGADNYSPWSTVSTFTTETQGIDAVGTAACTIFPNPASGSTTVSVSGVSGKVKIEVVDMNGRTVAAETLECSADCQKAMDVDGLAQGAYFVRITADQVNMVKKLIVR